MKRLFTIAPGRLLAGALWWLCGLGLLNQASAQAQVPAWALASAGGPVQACGNLTISATAVDAAGQVLVVGSFVGQVALGSKVLLSAGSSDLFVAKWVPATNTWAWAQRGGGTGPDNALGLAVSGGNIYVTGSISNALDNRNAVLLGGTVTLAGATATASPDLLVAKYTDQGTAPALVWAQVAGGTREDGGRSIAVRGSSVYVGGFLYNNRTNDCGVVFGGSGLAAGTAAQAGVGPIITFDMFLAKYTDQGSSASFGWSQVGGGTGQDYGNAVAVSSSGVYLTGEVTNSSANSNAVLFGGSGLAAGTVPQHGVDSFAGSDVVLAKYVDNGPSATLGWTQVAGGRSSDVGRALVASGSSVYVAGLATGGQGNYNAVWLGGSGTVAGTVPQYGATATFGGDLLVAKYFDNGSSAAVAWSQVAGGTGGDQAYGLALSGSLLYVLGGLQNDAANTNAVVFGGSGTALGTAPRPGVTAGLSTDFALARYTDLGSSARFDWAEVGGGEGLDQPTGLAVGGGSAFIVGAVSSPGAVFGGARNSPLYGATGGLVAQLLDQGSSGSWQALSAGLTSENVQARGMATDAAGNVFVTGYFVGQLVIGGTTLSSVGSTDIFLAKYVPATDTWAWAVSAGGTGADYGWGLAVSGSRIYLTGGLVNNSANASGVLFGGPNPTQGTAQSGSSPTTSPDLLLARYTDLGSSARLDWVQVAGGTGADVGRAVAVSGSSVYVAGNIASDLANSTGVVFGSGAGASAVPQYGASTTISPDLVLAKYTDQGTAATFNWSHVAGGSSDDQAQALAVNGSSVYVAGYQSNNLSNGSQVVFGGSGATAGTAPQHGASIYGYSDLVLAKYTDNGSTGTFRWSQVGGGHHLEQATGVAVSGSSVYLAGYIHNDATDQWDVRFGGAGATPGTIAVAGATGTASYDLVLAKYTDQGSSATLGWTQVGGGTANDLGYCVLARGNSVYLGGYITNTLSNSQGVVFGGAGAGQATQPGASARSSADVVVARYLDQGSNAALAWTQVGGGTGLEAAFGMAASSSALYVAGSLSSASTFGSTVINTPGGDASNPVSSFFVAGLGALALPTVPGSAIPTGLVLYPNPAGAGGCALLRGATPGAPVRVLDALGRQVAATAADATGAAQLSRLPAGLYLVRAGGSSVRLVVE